ncbi:HpcH/HpaI aldolase family protein [Limobrevibacterium gyesilva]|uniref:Aldolase/citrate lyase family protein n=1 Tax=Limobrevibacterium gyesilva TaxID=2991712 RepID=A0AA42CFW6_9PROT|nr:aldolase/citrate lyase family protein [Limobrevibacterium gyesilva]MCW3473225.1 aldolase/citrate lyase family protein [Limobrevibacterium gyesilva]
MIPNPTLLRLRESRLALGFCAYHLRTSASAMLAHATGHDWLFIDTEHGAFTVQEASQMCYAAIPLGITPIVRVCADALDEGTRALDNGAMGIIVPHVDTGAQAKRVAEAFRFPPIGRRSWGAPPAAFLYGGPSLGEAQAILNREVLVCAMIETEEAIGNVEDIARVPGIDVLMIGTTDLTTTMGIPGQWGHQKVQDAYHRVGEACRRHGKYVGMGGIGDDEWAPHYISRGAHMVLATSDHGMIMEAGSRRASFLRALEGKGATPAPA